MTEKRFFQDGNEILTWIRDKETWEKLKTDTDVINKLNELTEEKEICKQAYREIKEDAIRKTEENKELKQFKKSVFALINEKITFVNECEKNHNDIGIHHEYYRGADEILNLLKKELSE